MIPVTAIATASKQVATHSVSVLRVRGNFNGSGNAWLQFFNTVSTPADTSVPVLAPIPLNATSPFFAEFEIGAAWFSLGCYVCVSTTQGTKTLSTDTMDITIEMDAAEINYGTTLVGDLTTAVSGLQVWSEATGVSARKHLLSMEVDATNLTGTANQFIMLFATDTVNTGDSPLQNMIFPIAPGTVNTLENGYHFGEMCRDMQSYDGTNWHYGCTIKISSTASTYTASNGTCAIRAEYK